MDDDVLSGQAFIVDGLDDEEFDLDVPPTTGNEYLRRVRQEAKECPAVVVANIDTSVYQKRQTIQVNESSGCHPAPRGYGPTSAWEKMQIKNFTTVRQKLAQHKAKDSAVGKLNKKMPSGSDVEGWCKFCFGQLRPEISPSPNSHGTPPLVSIISVLDQYTVEKVLEYNISWFEATGFSKHQGQWLFALLASLQKPLTPEACSLIRILARDCANLRASLESADDPVLTPLNLLISLVTHYFDQTDLVAS